MVLVQRKQGDKCNNQDKAEGREEEQIDNGFGHIGLCWLSLACASQWIENNNKQSISL